jgi:hypothetical protein
MIDVSGIASEKNAPLCDFSLVAATFSPCRPDTLIVDLEKN